MSAGAQQLLAEAEADDPAKWHGFMPGDGDGDTMDVGALKGGNPRCTAASWHLPRCAGVRPRPGRSDARRRSPSASKPALAVHQPRHKIISKCTGFPCHPNHTWKTHQLSVSRLNCFCASTT